MRAIRRIQYFLCGLRGQTPIRHNHRYVDHVTGERFEIDTVGRWVEITRLDAERRGKNKVRKSMMRNAIATGVVEHDQEKCPICKPDNV